MRPRLRQLIPVANFSLLIACLVIAVIVPFALIIPGAYVVMILAVSLSASVRLRDVAGLWAGPALCIMHNAWAAGFLWQMSGGRR